MLKKAGFECLFNMKNNKKNEKMRRLRITRLSNKFTKEDNKMTREEKIAELQRMLSRAPEIMSPAQVIRCSPYGRNKIYQMIKDKELRSFIYQGRYIIAKVDLIEFLADNCDKQVHHRYTVQGTDCTL